MMQMQPHLQHHSQPPMHPGQVQPQPPPHHMQMQQQQQQQQMMVQQQQQMGMSPQQQQQQQQQMQQNHLTNANMNGMMNMGMTPPQSHYMNQQMSHSQQPTGQQHPQVPGHPMQQQQQQQGGHMSPHQVAPPLSGSPPQQNVTPQQCIRHGCQNPAIVNSDWEDEYCSNECVITHCRDVFGNWVQTNNSQQQTYSAVK